MASATLTRDTRRRGAFAVLTALTALIILGFGALAIDIAYLRLAQAQTQDIADAAAQAAVLALRQTGDQDQAEGAARAVVAANGVVGRAPRLADIQFGGWDPEAADPEFVPGTSVPNAVKVRVDRVDEDGPSWQLARLFGKERFDVAADATAATRSFQVIIVLDITNSWSEKNFGHARDASVLALETLGDSASGVDEIGMTIFTNRFAWEFTPLTRISDTAAYGEIMDDWEELATASKAGKDKSRYDGKNCKLHSGSKQNDFSSPEGGCYSNMPREYRDEPGTDHSAGMLLAKQMFEESFSSADYRAQIVLTDGRPNGLGSPGTARAEDGYTEERWREYLGPAPRSKDDIRWASIYAAQDMWDELGVHTWVVSFVADDWMMDDMPQGDGYYIRTTQAADLERIFLQIVSELPIAVVE